MRFRAIALLFVFSVCARAADVTGTWTGWFSDEGCASGRAKGGLYTATNPDCARQCIEKGSPVVLIAEQQKALYVVKGYADAKNDLGYKLEVSGTLDEASNMLTVTSVKHLERVVLSCSRTKH